jgi:hypothetical protein
MTDKNARVWTGTEWANISTPLISPNAIAAYQASAPASAFTGQIWIDSDSTINVFDANDYLSKVDASANYLRISSASATYLTQSSASTTYARINSPSFTGTVNFTSASVVFTSASVSGLPSGSTAINSNLLYNGAMQVVQRSASASGLTGTSVNAYYTADRWKFSTGSSNGTYTQSVENDAPTGSGFRKSLKMLCTDTNSMLPSGGTKDLICQTLEGQDLQSIRKGSASAQQLTLSFWIKSNATKTLIIELEDIDNSRYVSASCGTSSSQTWEYKTITFPADTSGVLDNDNNGSLQLNIWLAGGSTYGTGGTSSPGSLSNLQTTWGTTASARAPGLTLLTASQYIQFTGVKLEVGSSATGYEFKSYGQELSECQRYYWRSNTPVGAYASHGWARAISTTNSVCLIQKTVDMRVPPTAVEVSNIGLHIPTSTITAVTTSSIGAGTTTATEVYLGVASGLTAGTMYIISNNNNTAGYIGISAEL